MRVSVSSDLEGWEVKSHYAPLVKLSIQFVNDIRFQSIESETGEGEGPR